MSENRKMAEVMLMALLDNKSIKPDQKEIMRNFMVPLLEYIDDTYTPEETAKSMFMLTRFLSFALSYAIILCTIPTEVARRGHMKLMVRHFEESLNDSLGLFVAAHELSKDEPMKMALEEALKQR